MAILRFSKHGNMVYTVEIDDNIDYVWLGAPRRLSTVCSLGS